MANPTTAPFGITLGAPVESLPVLQALDQQKYIVQPPSPHPMFESYVVMATPQWGVVWIKGVTPTVENDGYGIQVRGTVDRLAEQLALRYGPCAKTDGMLPDAHSFGSDHWLWELWKNERLYHFLWARPQATGLPDDLAAIYLGAKAVDVSASHVHIEYSSAALAQAQADIERSLAGSL